MATARRAALLLLLAASLPGIGGRSATAWAQPGLAPAEAAVDTARAGSLLREETEWHLVAPGAPSLRLAHPHVEPGSLRAWVEGVAWDDESAFRVAAHDGVWIPLRPLGEPGGPPVLIKLTYLFRPAAVPPRRDLHPVVIAPAPQAPAPAASAAVAAPERQMRPGDLNVSGSKSVRMASGSRRDLSVDQNLRLTLDGMLTPQIAVHAVLSDDNLPVVPEGNTEQLRDIDKVLIEMKAPRWQATLGDFTARREGTEFGDFRRKLQGASLQASAAALEFDLLGGSPRGAYRTVQLRGEESNQGPYRLGAGDVGGDLFLVAGSERVLLDGQPLARGADRDYVIDYVRGTITFTYRRLITAESTIVIEFEEGEGAFARTVTGAGARGSFSLPVGGAPGAWSVRLTSERDDAQRPRTGELSPEDQQTLAQAGDDASAAVGGGVIEREPGRGAYRAQDVAGQTIYVFDPAAGAYDLQFFYTGPGGGDYGIDSLTVSGVRAYGWRGAGRGSYRVGRQLPLPTSQSLATLGARLGEPSSAGLDLEWNASRTDLNTLSARGDGDNAGVAWIARASTGEAEARVAGLALGLLQAKGRHENRDSRFRPLLQRKDIFHYERWGLGSRARSPGFLEERDAETELAAVWRAESERRFWRLDADWGRLEHGGGLEATRGAGTAAWRWEAWDGSSRWETARARDSADPLDVKRRRHHHQAGVTTAVARPGVRYEVEQWRDDAAAGDAAGGSRLRRWGAGVEAAPGRAFRWQGGWERALADSLRAGAWALERDSRTWRVAAAPPPVAGMRLVVDGAHRRVLGPSAPQTTRLAKLQLAGNWPRSRSDWSLAYGIDNSRTEVLERQVVFAGERQGDYNQAGDFVGRNQGDFNVVYAGTDSLVATTEASLDLTWRQDFGFLGPVRAWGGLATSTHLAVKGRSRAEQIGPLLRFARDALFDPAQTVLGEISLRQEAHLLRERRGTDLRLRLEYDEALDRQFASTPERRLRRHRQAVGTRSLTEYTSLQLRTGVTDEKRDTGVYGLGSNRAHDARTWRHEVEWSARPGLGNRVALAGEVIRRRDAVTTVAQREWALRPSARWRLERRWSATAELRWSEVDSDEPPGVLRPFFFAVPGGNREASARAVWDPSQQLTVSLVYFGRRLGDRGWQHDVRLESTARF